MCKPVEAYGLVGTGIIQRPGGEVGELRSRCDITYLSFYGMIV
jgi:hypothetical protein